LSDRHSRIRDLYNFGKFAIIELVHIIAHPFTITEEISILLTIIRKKILTEVSIKTRREIFTTGRIIQRTNARKSFVAPTSISPKATNVTTINQFYHFLIRIKVRHKFHTIELRITIPMAINGENGIIGELKTDA
jgi:hypothetical protein